MTWIAYTIGAFAAGAGKSVSMTPYLLGYLALFLLEAATVFLNDWFDFDSDRHNRNAGPFTGGSRVLVDGRLEHSAMRKGIALSLLAQWRHWSPCSRLPQQHRPARSSRCMPYSPHLRCVIPSRH